MPELPEVEMYRRYLDETALNQKVSNIEVLHPKVVGGKGELLNQLVGDQFTSSKRWGKNLFIQTEKDQTLFMHFGMTGNLEYYSASMEPPKYSRVVFELDNNYNLAYVSKRMFGRVGMVSDIESYIRVINLWGRTPWISLRKISPRHLPQRTKISKVHY